MDRAQQNPSTSSREQYVTELSGKMEEWDEKVDQITSKSNRNQMDSALLDDLLQKQAAAHDWLNEVKESDNTMWEELKAQASVASQSYQDVLERASERFKVSGPRDASHPSQRQEGGSGTQDSESDESTTSESMSQDEGEGSDKTRAGGTGGGTEAAESG